MTRYDITLPNERLRSYRYVTLFVMLIHVFMFSMLYGKTVSGTRESSVCILGWVISICSLFLVLVQIFRKKLHSYRPEIAFFILSMCWFILGAHWQGAVVCLLAASGMLTWRQPVVTVTSAYVRYPSFPAKKWNWQELSNIMVRDGVLTIDCRDNQLIQVLIDPHSADALDETIFNDFCQRHLLPAGI